MTRNNKLSNTKQRKLAIAALIVPSILFIFSLLTLVLINLIFNPTFWMTGDTEPINSTPLVIAILNVLLLIIGMLGVATLVPGVVTGIFLLVRSRRQQT